MLRLASVKETTENNRVIHHQLLHLLRICWLIFVLKLLPPAVHKIINELMYLRKPQCYSPDFTKSTQGTLQARIYVFLNNEPIFINQHSNLKLYFFFARLILTINLGFLSILVVPQTKWPAIFWLSKYKSSLLINPLH